MSRLGLLNSITGLFVSAKAGSVVTNDPISGEAYSSQSVEPWLGNAIISPTNPLPSSPVDGQKVTYSASGNGLVPPSSCTDLIVLGLSAATKVLRLTRVEISGIAGTILDTTVRLLLRTTADSGGTAATPGVYPHDPNDGAAVGTVSTYAGGLPTVNDGTNRVLRASKLLFNLAAPTAGSESGRLIWDFGDRPSKCPALRTTAQQFAINLNGVSVSSGSVDWSLEWTEE